MTTVENYSNIVETLFWKMAFWKVLVLTTFVFSIFCFLSAEKQPDTLNVLSILLPYCTAGSANVNFTIWASDGCYKWTSSRPEIANIRAVQKTSDQGDVCSQKAVVTSQSSKPEKQTAIIIAEEKVTGNVLCADVFVNRINRTEITTTTRELLLGQSPQLLDVIAFDDTGNLFSSLDGLVFEWELITVTGSIEASSILRIVPFAESINETSVAIYALEAKGLRGNSIIVEGINTGTAIVKAKLSHTTFKDVKAHSVKILVIDNLMIVPSMDVYIMINTAVKYRVRRFRQNSVIDIEMPSAQFKFVVSNTTVGTLDEPSSQVIGRALGYTQVFLIDNNMKDQSSTRQPSAGVHVVQPDHLGFSISPGGVWVLQTNCQYVITVDVYDKLNHKLYVAENIVIETTFPETYFAVSKSSMNGSYHVTRTLKSGKTLLHAVLGTVKLITTGEVVTLNPPVEGERELVIYDPISVVPAILVFPWIPVSGEYYRYELAAAGGSGHYSWTSDVTSIASVNTRGLLTTTTDTGMTEVKAHDSSNSMHFGVAQVYVLPPDNLKFVPSKVEVEIGTKLKLPVAAAAYLTAESSELKFFDDCRKMNLSVTVSDPSVFQVIGPSDEDDEIIVPGCTAVYLKALRQGYVIVTAKYKYKDINIKATITVAAYIPLKTLDPEDIAVVSLGSAKNLIVQGGPQPWVHDRSTHYEEVRAQKEDLISMRTDIIPQHPFADKRSLHFYHVTCKALGEQDLVVTIGNKPSETNHYPASSNITIKFACMLPATLTLEPDVKLPEISERRLSLQDCQSPNKEFHVRSPQAVKLRIILRDNKNRLFDNFTSLDVSWSSSNYDMASFDLTNVGVQMEYEEDLFSQHRMKSMSYQVCHLKLKKGSVTIKAAVAKYRPGILRNAGVSEKETLKKALTASLRLSLTSDIRIEPTQASIFNHPMNKVDLTIYGGSGRFLVQGSDEEIASVTAKKSIVKVTPKMTGVLTVTVYDQCLDSPNPATANIRISDIDSIHVTVVDKVELGHVINCTVMVLDELDKPLLVNQLELLNLTPRLSRDLLNIKPSERKGLDKAYYNLRGAAIGNTILTYSASPQNKPQITSEPKHIQVFPPLRLDPRYIILVPGATFQLKASGGPYPQVTTLFSIKNETVASVDSVGLITARVPGKSTITGAVEATDPQSGHTIVFSKDHVIVEVLRLTGVKIFTPSTNLVTETEIGLRAVGLNDETPFGFANSIPGIEFLWSSSNIDVCKLKSVYEKSGITIDSEKAFRVVLSCNRPGEVVIKLQAVFTDPTYKQAIFHAHLYDDVRIQVFEKLRLIHPRDGQLLLPHDVNVRIKTNRDGGRLSYSIMDVCSQSSRVDSRPLLTIDNRGQLETGMISGTAGVLVTSREEYGVNQSVVVHVEVKSVSSISIAPQSAVHTLSHKLHAFPVGMTAIFSVFLHDNIGRKFHSGNVPLKHRLNRFDSIHVTQGPDNGTYSIRAHNNGEAILNAWLVSSPHIADFVHLRATQAIVPFRSTYYLGEMICFKETVMGDEDTGVWWASNDDIVSIDPQSGIAIATSSGNTLIYYNASVSLPTYIEAKVVSKSEVEIVDPRKTVISNSPGSNINGSYVIHINFGEQRTIPLPGCDGAVVQDTSEGANLHFPFTCSLSLQNSHGFTTDKVFYIKPGYDHGKSACFIFPKKLSTDDAKLLSASQVNLVLSVGLQDPSKGMEFSSGFIDLEFFPSFVLDKHEVMMSCEEESVKIYGTDEMLQSLEVSSQSSSVVVKLEKDSSQIASVHISLADTMSFDEVTIEIKSRVTTQFERINVSYQSALPSPETQLPSSNECPGPACPNDQDSFKFHDIFIILCTIFIILLLILLCRPNRGPRHSPHTGASPYSYQSPYPSDSRNATAPFATPYDRSHVSPGRRRQSPVLARRATPGSSPRGLFSVTQ